MRRSLFVLLMVYWNQKKHFVQEVTMRKNISVEFTNERIIPSAGLAVVGAILGKGCPRHLLCNPIR